MPASEVQPVALSGERLQVTALFYDIVGSVELITRLDPEMVATIQRALHNEAIAAIHKFGGTVQQLQGDGGCAYFGIPTAQEDAAECAVNAALDLIARCKLLQHEQGERLKVRVGIATSMVVVAATRGTSLPGQIEVIGIAPALAARIQTDAAPNSVVVADSTYRLTHGAFEFEPLGEHLPKGFSEPVSLWRVAARRPTADRFSASRRVGAPLIGRERELAFCRQHWASAREGKGRLVAIHGEAGIGKSRLVAELRNDMSASVPVIVLQCKPRGDIRPLHPFLDHLEHELGAAAGGAELNAHVHAYLRSQQLDLSEQDAETIAFLYRQHIGLQAPASVDLGLAAEESRVRCQNAMLRLLCGRTYPCLIVIEDFHWADSLTATVVQRLPAAIGALPILAVVTARDETGLDGIEGANLFSLPLSHLDANATSQLCQSIWGADTPNDLAAFVHQRSDGVPLFAEQLTCLLMETSDKHPATSPSSSIDWNQALPSGAILSLQDLVAARLSTLGPLRRLTQVAGAIGREFDLDLLGRLVDSEALALPLQQAVRQLVQAGIFSAGAAEAEGTYRFRHVLIQEAAYESLLKVERRQLQAHIIQLVTSGEVPPLADDMLAWHYEQAERPFDAARCAISAAAGCIARSAMIEADRLLNFAQRQLEQMAPDIAHALQLDLLSARGPVAAALFGRGSPQASAVYDQGVALCGTSAAQDRARWFPLYWGWWFTAPSYEAQKTRSDIIVRDLEKTADPEVRLQSLHCAWATNFDAGRHAYCLDCIKAGLALYDEHRARLGSFRYGGHDARVCGLGERALALWFTGDEAGSARSMKEALDWAERLAHPDSVFHALDYAVGLSRYRHDLHGALSVAGRMRAIAEERSLPGGRAKAKLFGGWARALLGDEKQGLAEFNEGFALQREIGTEENLPIYHDMEAELLAQAGLFDEALAIMDRAIAGSSQSGQVFWLPELYRRRSRLRHALGASAEEAAADLHRAIELAESHAAAALVSRARADLGQLGLPDVPPP
ncbi:ATP-binding protein [Ancylobacter defluvii]|uniref:Adenylate/guanylate cyclase domain-containing protein n=1 Tax=Ancylobacter defluvii TaxID=1282440 RepID=A0A9W6K0I4_9HYPH|nr:AAA family ATPase [Ancylobacter defluvii]MBS7586472.1 AAA family ATPase [Ancylobacter defluvii]GLK85754.1 adenylate/guanylate cyclase domain-containing protein [Ancylobacter defluvii]